MKQKSAPTFYEKLTSRRHVDIYGAITYQTKPGLLGAIVVERPGFPDQRVYLITDESTRRVTILNMNTLKEARTFINADNCCAEEFHTWIDLITRINKTAS